MCGNRPKRQRVGSLLFLFGAAGVLVYLGYQGWLLKGLIPLQYVGYMLAAVGSLGLLGVNVWHGGPLDPRLDPAQDAAQFQSSDLGEGWYSIEEDVAQAAGLTARLHLEVAEGHPLHRVSVRALARRHVSDDVLFALEDGTGRVARVHLTWTGHPPERPPWPETDIYASFQAWAESLTCAR